MIKGLCHTAYRTNQMDAMLHFYCDGLGFKKIFSLKKDGDQPWIEYLKVNDHQFIELFHNAHKKVVIDRDTIGYCHLCIEVDDIQAIAQQMRDRGIAIDTEPKVGLDFNWQCWVHDPDGNRIEFMQLSPDCPQLNSK